MSKWVMVPKVPTKEMNRIGRDSLQMGCGCQAIYEDMIQAAPSPWIPVAERLPTAEDGDKTGRVMVWVGYWIVCDWKEVRRGQVPADSVWMPLPEGP